MAATRRSSPDTT